MCTEFTWQPQEFRFRQRYLPGTRMRSCLVLSTGLVTDQWTHITDRYQQPTLRTSGTGITRRRTEPHATARRTILNGAEMGLINKPCTCGSTIKAILLLTVGACVFMSGCKGSETTWSAEARSPDGKMIATARNG